MPSRTQSVLVEIFVATNTLLAPSQVKALPSLFGPDGSPCACADFPARSRSIRRTTLSGPAWALSPKDVINEAIGITDWLSGARWVLAPAQTSTWVPDKAHSEVDFSILHMGLSHVNGRFGNIGGAVT